MNGDSYAKAIGIVLKILMIFINIFKHLGRKLGPKILEMLEEEESEIKTMGNWDPSIQKQSYSTKLPMRPIRKLAGYTNANGMYYNLRTIIEVPVELQRTTPIGEWALKARESLFTSGRANDKPTAMNFLQFITTLNIIFLQDAATILIKHPERQGHLVFQLPCLTSDIFKVSIRNLEICTDN